MKIEKSRVLNIEQYLIGLPPLSVIRIISEQAVTAASKIAPGIDIADADLFLPKGVGPVTRFNADGKWIPNKNLPKESRYMGTFLWRWRERHGKEVVEREELKDRFRECYQRDQILPPSIELTFLHRDVETLFASPTIQVRDSNHDEIKHVVNLFLEIFGSCEIVKDNFERFNRIATTRVNWKFLPPGEYPWVSIKARLEDRLARLSPMTRGLIIQRQATLKNLSPLHTIEGQGGFTDYMAYVFEHPKIVVLESMRMDNAMYIFGDDWEECSQMTKAEILSGNRHLHRIIHSVGWETKVKALFMTDEVPAEE